MPRFKGAELCRFQWDLLSRGKTLFRSQAITHILETTRRNWTKLRQTRPSGLEVCGHLTLGDFNAPEQDVVACLMAQCFDGKIQCVGEEKRDFCFSENFILRRDIKKRVLAHDKQHWSLAVRISVGEDLAIGEAAGAAARVAAAQVATSCTIAEVQPPPPPPPRRPRQPPPTAADPIPPMPKRPPPTGADPIPPMPMRPPPTGVDPIPPMPMPVVLVPELQPPAELLLAPKWQSPAEVARPSVCPELAGQDEAARRISSAWLRSRELLHRLREQFAELRRRQEAETDAAGPEEVEDRTSSDSDLEERASSKSTTPRAVSDLAEETAKSRRLADSDDEDDFEPDFSEDVGQPGNEAEAGAASCSNAEAIPTAVKTWGVSRDGLPCKGLVRRLDGVFFVSEQQVLNAFDRAFEVRLAELHRLGLAEDAYLPKEGQVRAQKELEAMWWKTEVGRTYAERCRLFTNASEQVKKRTLPSYYRRSQFEDYGGREWCQLLIALGHVNAEVVKIFNEVCKDRAERKRYEHRSLPRAERPSADAPTRQGVKHKVSEAKALRDHAKRLAKKLTWKSSAAQRDAVAKAWATAEEVSRLAGSGFNDRHGNWVPPVQATLVETVLEEYFRRHDRWYS